jgi:hypothetical protein
MRSTARALLFSCLLACLACGNSVLLDERFNDTRLVNWTALDDSETVERPSKWVVEPDGWLHQRSNIWGRRGEAREEFIGRWYGTFLVAGDAGWADYTFSFKARAEDDDGFGAVFRFTDRERHYRLLFLQDGMNGGPLVRLDKREGREYTELWRAASGYKTGADLFVEISLEGDTIRASVDGRRLFEVKDGTHGRGKIGLFCFAQNGQAFDDVRVVGR